MMMMMVNALMKKQEDNPQSFLRLREGILLVAIQVVTVSYAAGLNPPGGVWADTKQDEHLIGNPILALTYHKRYTVFSSSNTTALMASSAVVLLLLFVRGDNSRRIWFNSLLRIVLSLGLVAMAVAYTAGSSRHKFTTAYASVSVGILFLYVLIIILVWIISASEGTAGTPVPGYSRSMVSAIFVASMTYTTGLNPPGGFWLDTQDGHRAGDPALLVHYRRRFTAFFVGNTIAFIASLFITPLVLTNNGLLDDVDDGVEDDPFDDLFKDCFLQCLYDILNYVQQCGLVIAYAAGSNMDKPYIAYVLLGGLALTPVVALIFVMTQKWFDRISVMIQKLFNLIFGMTQKWFKKVFKGSSDGDPTSSHDAGDSTSRDPTNTPAAPHDDNEGKSIEPFFVLMFTTFSAAVTYQAGLNPPGGLWPDDLDGHNAGHPILLAKQPTRYRVFMYCNSMALVASLVAIVMSLSQRCQTRRSRALSALLVLDLISLIGAYAAGCCRDVETSIHVIAMGGAIVVYVVFHMAFLMPSPDDKSPQPQGGGGQQEQKGVGWSRDLMLGILGATLTYQTGLTPPGGFWQRDDEFGHHAGEPVLLSTYPNRYIVFFYLNALCFMSSIFLTVFFVNRYLYEAGIRCRALFICVLAVFFGLIGAYAAGSYRTLGQSISMIKLGVVVFILIVSILLLVYRFGKKGNLIDEEQEEGNNQQTDTEPASSNKLESQEQHDVLEYLVLIGSIGATVTYQAGFAPPRGFWPDDSDGHAVGDPVLRDMNGYLYRLYFFFNTTAFLASSSIMNSGPLMIVVGKFLGMTKRTMKEKNQILYTALQAPTVLFAVGILGAYAAGSSSGWNNYIFSGALIAPVLLIIVLSSRVSKLVVKMANHLKVVSED
ncbi:hypothetical protein HU200_048941 [Digitaria exilis]|uniref:PGG domain-containing protein n=1 Tax=Digitaria exilis TaxID=1010633 RepID=A0A835B5P9_9POAL|nr:hypothetical protein HU200_048941 [Digitaria exilis]